MESPNSNNTIGKAVTYRSFALIVVIAAFWSTNTQAFNVSVDVPTAAARADNYTVLETRTLCLGNTELCADVRKLEYQTTILACIGSGCERTVTRKTWETMRVGFKAEIEFLPCIDHTQLYGLLEQVCKGMTLGSSGYLFVTRPYENSCTDNKISRKHFVLSSLGGEDAPSPNPYDDSDQTLSDHYYNHFATNGGFYGMSRQPHPVVNRYELLSLHESNFERRYRNWQLGKIGRNNSYMRASYEIESQAGNFSSDALAEIPNMVAARDNVAQEIDSIIALFPGFIVKERIADSGGDCRIIR